MSDHDPVITRRHLPSAVWFLPLLAAIIAGWLVYKNYHDKGIAIDVIFDSAAGLEANKTKVLYRGLPTGMVKELTIDPKLRRVRARIEMVPEMADSLTDKAQFWLVKPQVSLSGVRGLETLLSGHYIGFQPGQKGKRATHFEALDQPPPPLKNASGLYLTLTTDSARSVYQGAKIYYRDIEVGEVLSHALSEDGKKVLIEVYIEPRFTYLIRETTRFWNASGIKIKTDLPKVDIQIGSLASIIAGGIQFSEPDEHAEPASSGLVMPLYDNYEAAENGITVNVRFPGTTELSEGTRVKHQGIEIGRVTQQHLSDDLAYLDATLLIDPRAESMLTRGARFWLQSPQLSWQNLRAIGKLLSGSYIELATGPGEATRTFAAVEAPPASAALRQGKPVKLISPTLGSVRRGTPLLYRQLPVGEVLDYALAPNGDQVVISAAIAKPYVHLLKSGSRFWHSSGVQVHASLEEGVSVRTESAQALLQGGIAFFNPPDADRPATPEHYRLHSDFASASEQGRLSDSSHPGTLNIRLHTSDSVDISTGDPITYKHIPVGEVTGRQLSKDGQSLIIYARIEPTFTHLVSDASRFWQASGIQVKGSLKGVDVRAESLASLVRGGIAFANYPAGAPAKAVNANHLFTLYPDHNSSVRQPLRVEVDFPAGKNLQPNAEVRYQGQIIGRVKDVHLSGQGKGLRAGLHLYRDGHFLAADATDFWIVEPRIRLSAIEHPEGMLTGNYVAAMQHTRGGKARFHFTGLHQPPAFQDATGLHLRVHASTLGSLVKGSPVYYRKVPIGAVTGFDLSTDRSAVVIYVNVRPDYTDLIRQDSVFRNVSGVQVGVSLLGGIDIKADSLEALIGGGLSVSSPVDSPAATEHAEYILDEDDS